MSYVEEMFSLEGQTAVITGGAGAIGAVMSDALLRAGANVVVWSRTQASISPETCRKINLGNLDPATIDPENFRGREAEGILFVENAGEILHRLRSHQNGGTP